MKNSVFRKASIERLSSPEQLDQIMQVTSTRGWLALAGVGLLLTAAVAWAFYGHIPTDVRAMGVLIKSGGVYNIVPRSSGQIADMAVRPGNVVQAGQVIARVEQPAIVDQIKKTRQQLLELKRRHRNLQEYGATDAELQEDLANQQRIDLERSIRSTREQIGWLEETIASQSRLLDDGLITKQALLLSRERLRSTEERIEYLEHELKQIDIRMLSLSNRRNQELLGSSLQISELESEIERLVDQHLLASEVTSPYAGRILEVMAEAGSIVVPGQAIMRLDLVGDHIQDLEAVLYVPSSDGKKVRRGMTVQISPTTVKREEHGFMVGTVSRVSDFPSTPEAMARVLKNEQLVRLLSGGGAPYETYASLKLDPSSKTGFRWSSSAGPEAGIQSGTICSATIRIEERRPAELVMPVLRKILGV